MTTVYHDPIDTGAAANASTFNTRFADLDAAIEDANDRISTIIAQDGDSDTEVVDSRNNYTVLNDRLDDMYLSDDVLLVDGTFEGESTAKRFSTISAALAACTGGETIKIAPGIYTGNITVADQGVKLIGSGAPYYDSGTGRLVNGTIIRGRIQLNSVVGVEIYNLGVDLVGVDGTDCIAGSTVDSDLHRRFHNLTLLGNGSAALAHGLYCAGHYNEVHSVRIYNCYHGIAVHGSYTNISNIGLYSCNSSAIIVKAKSAVNCLHVNISNITMQGDTASAAVRSGPIILQTEDSVNVRYVNVSNVTAKNCSIGAVFINRNDNTGTISECAFTNIVSTGNLGSGSVGDFWMDSGDNIIFTNCRSTLRTAGYAFNVDSGDNVGDVYVYGSYADATASGSGTGTFKYFEVNGTPTNVVATTRVFAPAGFRTVSISLADDAVYDFANGGQGIMMVATTNGAFAATAYLLASYRAQATPVLQSISAGSATTVGTSALSGTTGTDAKMNVACTDGHIFVENRLGSTRTFMIFLAA